MSPKASNVTSMTIAAYIKDDLTARLSSGEELSLTIDSLADHYQVSFTPVRSAIAELLDEGLIEKGENRRLVVSGRIQNRRSKQRVPDPPQDPFETVANDLVRLSLQGEAIYLREEATAEKYKMSRSMVRNIFHRLAGNGMLDHIPRRGWRLRPFRQQDMQAFIEVREVLELKALELACPRLDLDRIQDLLEGNQLPSTDDQPVTIDNSLHAYVIEQANNTYISDFFQRHGPYYDILFDWEDQDRQTAMDTVLQHQAILKALLAKDWQTARSALSYHIRYNHPILSKTSSSLEDKSSDTTEGSRRAC